ncbi:MAG TPA: VTT domain-containing protein, partial [Steroidobacteraceae bacterium]|nr:VTT domain-containing protein [Steroidobacteraceae bacterium]
AEERPASRNRPENAAASRRAVRAEIPAIMHSLQETPLPRTDRPSLLRPRENCWHVAPAERASVIVDAADYFRAFVEAALRAERTLVIVGWGFHSRMLLAHEPLPGNAPPMLGEFLNFLARRRSRLHIYILIWDFPMAFSQGRELPAFYRFNWRPHRRVHLRLDDTHPVIGSHHQKIIVVDGTVAFCGGIDLTHRRWDTSGHPAEDERRRVADEPYPPFHDLMLAVDGGAAHALGRLVAERWCRAGGRRLHLPAVRSDPWPEPLEPDFTGVPVAISRTMPGRGPEPPVREIERLHLDLIAAARRSIYLENQYFTADRVADALAVRLAEPDGPEIVIVLRLLSNGWLEELTMQTRRSQILKRLRQADRYGRLKVYYPEIEGLAPGTCVNMHSKISIVDDEWLRIGSANLSNRSLGFDTECDLTIEARGDPRVQSTIRQVRFRLVAEHLGRDRAEIEAAVEACGAMAPVIERCRGGARWLEPLIPQHDIPAVLGEAMRVGDPESPVSLQRLVDEFSPEPQERPRRARWIYLLVAVLSIAALAALWRYTPLAELASAEAVTRWANQFAGQWWAPLVILFGYTASAVIMFPRPLITLFAVVAFGTWLGFGYAMAGILVATLVTYGAGLLLSRRTVRRIAGPRLGRLDSLLRKRGVLKMTAVRLVPLAPFAVIGLVAGALRISIWHYTLGTLLGMLPGTLTATVFGDQVRGALFGQDGLNLWLIFGVMAVVVALTVIVRRWLLRADEPPPIHDPEEDS